MSIGIREIAPTAQPGFGNLAYAGEVQRALVSPDSVVMYSVPEGSKYHSVMQTIILDETGLGSLSEPGDPTAVRIDRELQMVGVLPRDADFPWGVFTKRKVGDVAKGDRLVFRDKLGEIVCSKPVNLIHRSPTGQNT